MAWLQCEHTITKTTKSYVLKKPLTTIGRARGNDLVIDDPMVSGTHASVTRKGQAFTITLTDRSSELYVNGKRAQSKGLSEGDAVLLGA